MGMMHRIWPGTQRLLLWGDPRLRPATRAHLVSAAAMEWRSASRSRSKAGAAPALRVTGVLMRTRR